MAEGLLCLVCIIMVVWLLMLMSENRRLKADVAKLKYQLRDYLDDPSRRVEIRPGRKLTTSEINRISQPTQRAAT
jgi:hypothetical protein